MSTRYMVETQIIPRGIKDPNVLQVMEKVKRERFVPASYQSLAYSDCPLPIASGQTISQPYMVAFMTEQLRVDPNSRVLEVGTGSGYQTAILAELVKEIYTIEYIANLGNAARSLHQELGYSNIHYRLGDGHFGWPEVAPFDAIMVTAAPDETPEALLEQLAPGGRLIIPVGPNGQTQSLLIYEKDSKNNLRKSNLMPVRFVPLVGGTTQNKEAEVSS